MILVDKVIRNPYNLYLRMWLVDPSRMCRKHLLGEHVELHMLKGAILKNKNIKGFLDTGLVELHSIKKRHDELVTEMLKRGYNHKSPILDNPTSLVAGYVDVQKNEQELHNRCKNCTF